jgi:hypothetical protein
MMTDMPDSPAHARTGRKPLSTTALPPEPKGSVKAAAWLVLGSMGGTSVTYQIWHATHSHMSIGLAVLYGIAPVVVSMSLSHVAAEGGPLGRWMQFAIYLAVALAMALSASAIASVVAPAAGTGWRWAFGAVLDGPSLICLRVIIVQQQRRTERAEAVEAAERATTEAAERAAEEAAERAVREAGARAAAAAAEQARIEAEAKAQAEAAERTRKAAERTAQRAPKDPQAERARREYRKSLLEGDPLTDRALAAKFPGRERTWAANRIKEVNAMQASEPQPLHAVAGTK